MRKLHLGIAGIGLAVAALAAVIGIAAPSAHTERRAAAGPSAPPSSARTPYEQGVDAAHQHGLRVWVETDLVKRWLAGPASFQDAVAKVGALAQRPGVVGIKIADELGYRDGLDSPEKISAFLADSRSALGAAAPGKRLLVDILVPELGCLPGYTPPLRWATICAAQARGQFPQLALSKVDDYVGSHTFDVVDLSTGLLPDRTYAGWGMDRDTAARNAWTEVHRRGWDRLVTLQARKALAHTGRYAEADAEAMLTTFVDIPRSSGAVAVDVWTWRQAYEGEIYRLMDPGLRPNDLWTALARRRSSGAVLFTHLSPRSVEVGLDTDLAALAQVFTDVFMAAGTG